MLQNIKSLLETNVGLFLLVFLMFDLVPVLVQKKLPVNAKKKPYTWKLIMEIDVLS